MTNIPPARTLAPAQRCRVLIYDTLDETSTVVFETGDVLLEAPNWTTDGRLILNGDGVLWALDPRPGAAPRRLEIAGVPTLNNDHVLAPGGESIYISANDWQIYRAPIEGGDAERITDPDDAWLHFLHGVSPDGRRLAYTAITVADGPRLVTADIRTMSVDGADDIPLTDGQIADGPEYSPDGDWIYFNTEQFSDRPGHAQLAHMRIDGSELEQLTFDDRVNWFPHLSPDGESIVYLSFPPGTEGHPADLPVELKLVRHGRWDQARAVATLPGGQGTINVNSWAPDGRRFAYVDYPFTTDRIHEDGP